MDKFKQKTEKKKVLLMGRSGAGKSSMRSIIFSNYVAKDVRRLPTTIGVESSTFKFLGNLMLNIWDCGGQGAYVESYLHDSAERTKVFSGVGVLIYVFDVESREFDTEDRNARDLVTYSAIVKALAENSPQARVFALVHKMDLVQTDFREQVLKDKSSAIRQRSGTFQRTIRTYGTSIWDQTLYKAWGMIVHSLIPNLDVIEGILSDLVGITEAEEIILFERTTFLTVTSVKSEIGERNPYEDRFERLSNIIKTFKSSISTFTGSSTSSHQFGELYIKTTRFNLIVAMLTTNTYALIVLPPGEVELQCTRLNLFIARDQFVQLAGFSDESRKSQ
ncbi:MAG: GTP-binding protein gtr1 [Heterodermia speciosa]|uniref:GTP-binding protein n=1 Tax=Heterodermia speciosa TaxID=116794 RepID=A0A8H3IDJ3_9LECA|nr:MAG: GTP-binding protein gtr1 [Heterodermia speciosa]